MNWQPIKTAPLDGTEILLWGKTNLDLNQFNPPMHSFQGRWGAGRWINLTINYGENSHAAPDMLCTHWAPMPDGPPVQASIEPELAALIALARVQYDALTPREKEAMWAAQRASWARQDMD